MKKYISIFTAVMVMATMTACTTSSEEDITSATAEVTTQTTTEITTETTTEITTEDTTEITTEATTEITTEETAENGADWNIENVAKVFSDLVYAELENNKTSDDPTYFKLLSSDREKVEGVPDLEAFDSDVIIMDVDFDGIPELFTGAHGMTEMGKYSVYSADGSSYGTDMFSCQFYYDMCVVDGCAYVHGGGLSGSGWTKLTQGLPSVSYADFISETEPNDMVVRINGENQSLTGLTNDEAKALYPQYLGVEYDQLNVNEDIDYQNPPYLFVHGCLEVPNPESYTDVDIYSALLTMLTEYKEKSQQQ